MVVKVISVFMAMTVIALSSSGAWATAITVVDEAQQPLATVMVSRVPVDKPVLPLDDHGYPQPGAVHQSLAEATRFTSAEGEVTFAAPTSDGPVRYRLRKPGFADQWLTADAIAEPIVLKTIKDPQQLAEQKASNLWLSQLDFNGDEDFKKHFQLNCGFCHQQASAFMRNERSPEQWLEIINRMNGYGARIADDDRQPLADYLSEGYRALRAKAESLPETKTWAPELAKTEITEWPIGDAFSQMHDFIIHPNGFVYVGDNLQDRIYEVDPKTGQFSVYVVPREEGMTLGGFMGNRFKTFPKLANYFGVHSFAISPKDGHIFITPSMHRGLLEFDPVSKAFTVHKMDDGFYPHTIRADDHDRIWFTLAVSSQIAMLDRATGEFTYYDLPARSLKEWAILKALPLIFSFDPENRPTPAVDRDSTGVPMPYGIDIAPDGRVWFARLYGNDIGYIDPQTGEVTMIDIPFNGPRRLRIDARGDVWMVAFQDSKLVRYNPKTEVFSHFDTPVVNELPYALNVDRKRNVVWVNGNQSDTIFRFDIDSEKWDVYPLPRQRSFTRDIEIDEEGAVYTSNSHFPSWQIEDGQPTLIRLKAIEQ